jgi:leucyl/phenylalanyl-tRNA--protein transferase
MPTEPPPSPWRLPAPREWPDSDLIGLGADLEPGTMLMAYRGGIFPMAVEGSLGWWSPVERGVIPVTGLRVPRSLRKACRRFEIRVDTACAEVIEACADPARSGAWIDDDFVAAYLELHRLGWVHSVEAWRDGELAGGLFGVSINGLFAGESMFHHERDASKAALVGLVELLADEHAERRLLDTQWWTDHLGSLGAVEIPRAAYLARLRDALTLPPPARLAHRRGG